MMKLRFIFILYIVNLNFSYAQNKYDWPEYGISFFSQIQYNLEPLYEENIDNGALWSLDADEIGIEVEACFTSEQSKLFVEDIEYAAKEIAKDMQYSPISEGKYIKGNFRGYYIKSNDIDFEGKKYPVIIAAIIDDENKLSFEIVIDCYDGNLKNGLDFLNSIKYKPKN